MKSVVVFLLIAVIALGMLGVWQRARLTGEDNSMNATNEQGEANPLAELARGPAAPNIVSDTWLNSKSLAPSDLRGHVVLVEFWTFD